MRPPVAIGEGGLAMRVQAHHDAWARPTRRAPIQRRASSSSSATLVWAKLSSRYGCSRHSSRYRAIVVRPSGQMSTTAIRSKTRRSPTVCASRASITSHRSGCAARTSDHRTDQTVTAGPGGDQLCGIRAAARPAEAGCEAGCSGGLPVAPAPAPGAWRPAPGAPGGRRRRIRVTRQRGDSALARRPARRRGRSTRTSCRR